MSRIGTFAALAIAIASEACIHRHREWPPRNTHKIISFSTEKRAVVAAFIRRALSELPESVVTCLSIENKEDAPYAYDPDAALLNDVKGRQRVVPSKDCPRTYGGEAWMVGQSPPKPPVGYVNPWSVFLRDIQFKGRDRTDAVVERGQTGFKYVLYCNAVRVGHNNWKVTCPAGVYLHLS
jgi:hypothetical protein